MCSDGLGLSGTLPIIQTIFLYSLPLHAACNLLHLGFAKTFQTAFFKHIMHYFSIHTPSGEHLGFFIMLADDESEQQPQSGRFMIKLQSENEPQAQAAVRALEAYQTTDEPFYWATDKDRVTLFDDKNTIGTIRNEYLIINGQTLLLNDLTGTL